MFELLNQYLPEIATVGAVLVPVIPMLRSRVVSDKKVLLKFEDLKAQSDLKLEEIKTVAEELKKKEANITKSVSSVSNVVESMKNEVDHIKKDIQGEMTKVSETLLQFEQGDMYQKMIDGVKRLETMEAQSVIKDQLIEKQSLMLKELSKRLGELK